MKLLIRNLSRATTEKELRALFIQFGRVQSCDLVLDKTTGKSKGFAFVEMPKVGEAKVAVKSLNNKEVAGEKIRVKKAESRVEDKAEDTAEDTVEDMVEINDGSDVAGNDEAQVTDASEVNTKKFSWKERKIT